MKITLTNIELTNIMGYINSEDSIAKKANMKFTMEFVWKFRKNVKKLNDAYDMFTKLQEEIMQSYATDEYSFVDENGNRLVKPECIEEYSRKMNELYLQSNELDIDMVKIEKLCMGGLEGMDKVEISIPELEVLSFMIEDDFEEEKKEIENEDNEVLTGEVE